MCVPMKEEEKRKVGMAVEKEGKQREVQVVAAMPRVLRRLSQQNPQEEEYEKLGYVDIYKQRPHEPS